MTNTKQKELSEMVDFFQDKYEKLCEYVTISELKRNLMPTHNQLCEMVEDQFGDDVDELNDPEMGDFNNGFNYGVLAGMNLILDALEEGIDVACDNFDDFKESIK